MWMIPALDVINEIVGFPANNNNSASFKCRQQITKQSGNGDTKFVEITGSIKISK